MSIEEFTWKEMNKILDARYDELMLEMSHDQTVEVIEREYNTQYIDDIIEGKLEATMIFKIRESIKIDASMGEASSNVINPHKHSRINFSQSAPKDTTYSLGGKYPFNKEDYKEKDKDYKTYGRRQPVNEIRTLQTASQSSSILNLAAWDPQLWPEVIDRWKVDAVKAWQNQTHDDNMWEYLETLLGEVIGNWYNTYRRDFAERVLETKALGNNPYNFISLIREICIRLDSARGNIDL